MQRKIVSIIACILLSLSFLTIMTKGREQIAANAQITPPRGNTFIIATRLTLTDPHNMNPYIGQAGHNNYGNIFAIYEDLFYNNLMTNQIMPWLATGYNYSSDFLTFTVTLRKGVYWSDGYPFTADDVIYTYDMLRQNKTKIPVGQTIDVLTSAVNKVDNYTVQFVGRTPNARLLTSTIVAGQTVGSNVFILPKHIWQNQDPLTFQNWPPIGTGPFRYISQTQTSSLLQRRDDYWGWDVAGVRPAMQYIEAIYANPADVHTILFSQDQLDQGGKVAGITAASISTMQKSNPFVQGMGTTNPTYNDVVVRTIDFNLDNYPWSVPQVRRAVQYLINQTEMSVVQQGGLYQYPGTALVMDMHQLMGKDYVNLFNSQVNPLYNTSAYDPSKAADLLTSVGFSKGIDGVWVSSNGTRLEAELIIPTGTAFEMYALQQDMANFGIPVTIRPVDTATWTTTRGGCTYKDWLWGYWGLDCTTDPYDAICLFETSRLVPKGQQTGSNYVRFHNATLDAIIANWTTQSPSSDAAKQLFVQAMKIVLDQMPVAGICESRDFGIVNTKHWVNYPTANNLYTTIQWWWKQYWTVLMGFQDPTTNQWVGGIQPSSVEYATVYATKNVSSFRGVDGILVSALKAGDAVRMPVDDAQLLISKSMASYSPPAPVIDLSNLAALAQSVQSLSTQNQQLSQKLDSLSSNMSNLQNQYNTMQSILIVLGVVTIIAVAAVIVLVVRRTKE